MSEVEKSRITSLATIFIANLFLFCFLRDFYEVKTNDIVPKCLFTRCVKGKKKNIYLCSPLVRRILSNNQDQIKVCDYFGYDKILFGISFTFFYKKK